MAWLDEVFAELQFLNSLFSPHLDFTITLDDSFGLIGLHRARMVVDHFVYFFTGLLDLLNCQYFLLRISPSLGRFRPALLQTARRLVVEVELFRFDLLLDLLRVEDL